MGRKRFAALLTGCALIASGPARAIPVEVEPIVSVPHISEPIEEAPVSTYHGSTEEEEAPAQAYHGSDDEDDSPQTSGYYARAPLPTDVTPADQDPEPADNSAADSTVVGQDDGGLIDNTYGPVLQEDQQEEKDHESNWQAALELLSCMAFAGGLMVIVWLLVGRRR